jgi:hypothetical protein
LIDNGVIDTTLSFILLACGGGMYNQCGGYYSKTACFRRPN